MEKEIEELTQQRDRAESRLDYLIRVTGTDPNSLPWVGLTNEYPASDTHDGDSLKNNGLADMASSKVDFIEENSPSQHYVPDPSQETTIYPDDIYNN